MEFTKVTEISVKHAPSSGAATIEVRNADLKETRFRLRDNATDKYLTRRGWTKTASYLPMEAALADGVGVLTLDAELARKIPADANLSLEQPSSDLRAAFSWPAPQPSDEDEPARQDDGVPAADDVDITFPPDLALESFEPQIMDEELKHEPPPQDADPGPAPAAANDDNRRQWKPLAAAAAIFLAIGMGVGSLFAGTDDDAVREARESASMQIEKQRWEFEKQLSAARSEASTASLDKEKTAEARIAGLSESADQLTAERDTANAALRERDAKIASLEEKLKSAQAQIEAVRSNIEETARAQIAALEDRNAKLSGEVEQARTELQAKTQAADEAEARAREIEAQLASLRETSLKQAEELKAGFDGQKQGLDAEIGKAGERLAASEATVKELRDKLAAAAGEIEAAKNSASATASAQGDALKKQIETLTAKARENDALLAEREKTLRDVQAKLSVADVQIDALKIAAGKSAETDLETSALREKVTRQTAELDRLSQTLADRDARLAETRQKLVDAETRLASAITPQAPNAADADADRQPASDEALAQLREERDLYAKELKSLTANFDALRNEKEELEKSVAKLGADLKDGTLTTSQIPSKAIWGATAIDAMGAIYSLQNQTNEKSAAENVTAMCRGKSRQRCEPLSTYSNACFSLARIEGEGPANDNFAYFVHKDWKVASETALERCRSMGAACTIRFTACSPDRLSKPVSN